jgi:hypothetical protein
MSEGVETIVLETHNFGKTAKFWQQLGYELTFESDHGSGLLVNKSGGPALFIAERPRTQALRIELHLKSPDAKTRPPAPVEIVGDWQPSHWGTQLLEIRDPDGRTHFLEHGHENAM